MNAPTHNTAVRRVRRHRAPYSQEITDAERRVLNLLPQGFTAGQMATRLNLSESTVKTHLRTISERWDAQGRLAVLTAAYLRGELPLPEGPELLVLRSALLEIARLVGTSDEPDGLDPEVVISALQAQQAAFTAEENRA